MLAAILIATRLLWHSITLLCWLKVYLNTMLWIIDQLGRTKFVTTPDLLLWYWQVPMAGAYGRESERENSIHYTFWPLPVYSDALQYAGCTSNAPTNNGSIAARTWRKCRCLSLQPYKLQPFVVTMCFNDFDKQDNKSEKVPSNMSTYDMLSGTELFSLNSRIEAVLSFPTQKTKKQVRAYILETT